LKAGFASLPAPANNFELVLPEDDVGAEEESEDVAEAMRIEDASEREARLKSIREEEERKALARRTQVVKRGLPRPIDFDAAAYLAQLELTTADDEEDTAQLSAEDAAARKEAERLVAIEMVKLLEHDAITYPVAGGKRAGGGVSSLPFIKDEDLAAARAAVHSEMAESVGLPGASEALLKRAIAMDTSAFDSVWRPRYDALVYDATTRKMVPKTSLTKEQQIAGYKAQLDMNRERMARESAKTTKVERKLAVVLGGYMARTKTLSAKLAEGHEDVARSRIELESFARLAVNEEGAMVRRTEALKDEVDRLERRQRDGQARFRELMEVKERLVNEIGELEMEEAERINEAALAGMEQGEEE
jgi:pre-mRNA-splicing factor CDC5/CEF1